MLKNRKPFSMAGIWEEWNDPAGQIIRTFSILTTEPNILMARLHTRMPVILDPVDEQRWLHDPPEKIVPELFFPFPAEKMSAYPVSRLVNSPANDNPSIIKPAGDSLL